MKNIESEKKKKKNVAAPFKVKGKTFSVRGRENFTAKINRTGVPKHPLILNEIITNPKWGYNFASRPELELCQQINSISEYKWET